VAIDAGSGQGLWVARYDGPGHGDEFTCWVTCVEATPDGATVVVTGASAATGTSNYAYVTVAYRASDGASRWSARYDGPAGGNDYANDLAISPTGDRVFVTGQRESAPFVNDVATVAYDMPTGTQAWLAEFDGPAHGDDFASTIAASPDGLALYVIGSASSLTTGYDYLTLSYLPSSGARRWAARYDGPGHGDDLGFFLTVSTTGSRVYVTGSSVGALGDGDFATVAYEGA